MKIYFILGILQNYMEFKISPKLEENILEQFGLIIDEDPHKIFPIELLDESKN